MQAQQALLCSPGNPGVAGCPIGTHAVLACPAYHSIAQRTHLWWRAATLAMPSSRSSFSDASMPYSSGCKQGEMSRF